MENLHGTWGRPRHEGRSTVKRNRLAKVIIFTISGSLLLIYIHVLICTAYPAPPSQVTCTAAARAAALNLSKHVHTFLRCRSEVPSAYTLFYYNYSRLCMCAQRNYIIAWSSNSNSIINTWALIALYEPWMHIMNAYEGHDNNNKNIIPNYVKSIMSLPHVSATFSLSFSISLVGYSGNLSKLKLQRKGNHVSSTLL